MDIEKALAEFDELIDSFPSHVAETPRSVLKGWVTGSLLQMKKDTLEEAIDFICGRLKTQVVQNGLGEMVDMKEVIASLNEQPEGKLKD